MFFTASSELKNYFSFFEKLLRFSLKPSLDYEIIYLMLGLKMPKYQNKKTESSRL